ncbi:4-hydroxyphenylpyruvate dioxygenase [Paraburkholderia sp. SIMBA_055]|jgi:4-hydroxyphenylpyruvate dioxygenase|uniref:4-hydroxyphenylpyruvate dioxygenase n=1 Tax=Paraburkholderia graminis (strain ATCC 700544 / DSM 17151 / LMG 18924 / NCIMB 13744 / C4D1M) TaxID=396598 RepID=B1GAU4_PARG4|nr:4-hydroxyphenylpyruvate dioxygenase [Paraburkholderia graminis]AXF09388.1 4-hydroxyphenylpyruvate dioxygenase [Paraburkholderia graminis]EDT06749.1 4-hydroxyphenylpyruvate dioxygenase [Paraburkholderia graminis C4D1M]MDR6469704.1 4-hydroxyphenylpyruvate dioxygenase [Paraburkholderia graminis]MDR6478756.1 4-hydroxyphenylpyruvate dioxygenase [Paraburkholderia graminis]CAB3710230.1 4-hydroxyphenylpyruvate dioxygenase [Paraburkholderia graminis C4D1M]
MQVSTWDNPVGTDGFEFIEYTAPDPKALGKLFEQMGFTAIARHRHKDVTLYRQGEINFIVNGEPDSFAQRFARLHGPSICAIAFRVQDAGKAYRQAIEKGAWGFDNKTGPMELNIPAIKGIGDSLIYFVDRWRGKNGAAPGSVGDIDIYDVDFEPIAGANPNPVGHGLTYIDHLTHNVHRGRMQEWAEFYERLFNFREVRYFDIEGKVTGVKSKAMTSPCGKIRIPINEEGSETSGQIQEYLDAYHGEGIQHIALGSNDIYRTVDGLRASNISLLDTIDTYYELVDRRVPNHGEPLDELRKRKILIDGAPDDLLLQIFTENQIGPIFFEIIQRKGNQGFGEGNFKALFESIELDQIRRGVVQDKA